MLVDVIITCHNKEKWVQRAIQGVMEQTFSDFKCIVVDDGSTDDSLKIIEQSIQSDKRFELVAIENAGVANARNYGISLGSAPYICCLDADDTIHPRFLETLYRELEKDKTIGIGYTALAGIAHNNEIVEIDWGDCSHDAQFEGKNQVPCCNLFRRHIWDRTGGYNQRYAPLGAGAEDAEFWLRAFEIGYTAKKITSEPLFVYSMATGVTKRSDYKEVDWIAWHKNKHSFASVKSPGVHDVVDYENPRFAIIIPVGPGHEHLLFDALDSVENQSVSDWEVCVVLDTDNINAFYLDRLKNGYPYVRFVQNTSDKHGAGIARNLGARHTNAPLLVFLDADDYLQPNFLEYTYAVMESEGAQWVYTDLWSQTFSETPVNGNINIKTSLGYETVKRTALDDFSAENEFYGGTAAVTALYRRDDFNEVGGFDEQYNREDWDFHMRLAINGRCGLRLPLPLFTYRLHAGYRREYKGKAINEEESKALKKEDVKRIQSMYPLEKLEMACSTCQKKIIPAGVNDMITMDYIANPLFAQDGMVFTGKVTGRKYVMDKMKIRNVHPQDAEVFQRISMFKPEPQPRVPIAQQTEEMQEPVISTTQRRVVELPREEQLAIHNKWLEEQMKLARAEAEKEELLIAEKLNKIPSKKEKRDIGTLSLNTLKEMDALEPLKPETATVMLEEEKAGKSRKTVIAWLEKKLD
jgi:glycosyltransferase involved in cell wall biosynthesis